MSRAEERLLWFLCDPSLSDHDFRILADLLRRGGGDEIADNARHLRGAVRKKDWREVRRRLRRENEEEYDDPLAERVSRLLVTEASLTVAVALKALAEELGYQGTMPQRMTLDAGLNRLQKEFEASEILSAAHRIRNLVVHQPTTVKDATMWRLRRRFRDSD